MTASIEYNKLQLSPDTTDALREGLRVLIDTQNAVSRLVHNALPPESSAATPEQIRVYTLAMIVEVVELLNEYNWKPWKQPNDVDRAKIAAEMADILAFLGVLLIFAESYGVSVGSIAEQYAEKSKTNVDRFFHRVEGY